MTTTLRTLAAALVLFACNKPATSPSTPNDTATPPTEGDTATPPAQAECKPTGCSATVCSDEEVMTTCEYKPEYECYKTATCTRQADGQCGWTKSAELDACLASPPPMQ
ncbi:MAG TPA: hypothetical protein VG755_39495 [Nannocystaceae bacterium]|nr:hypothetical protein [Nannocystaceae bacterium]